MSTPQIDRLRTHCHRLRVYRVEAELATLLEQAAERELACSDFLDELLALEIRSKADKQRSITGPLPSAIRDRQSVRHGGA